MASALKKVVRIHESKDCEINHDNFGSTTYNLEDFVDHLVGVETEDKWRTWGREYIEVPVKILRKFGVESSKPLTFYVNYVYCNPKNYVYSGSIFSGNAAWFDEYRDLSVNGILRSESFELAKNALENSDSKSSFLEYFNSLQEKWLEVPIHNPHKASIAKRMSTSLK
jgi:hypothetical protein